MTSISFCVAFCIFLVVSRASSQHCNFEYSSYHSGEDERESHHNFTMKVAQNCERGSFTAQLMIKMAIDDENLQVFESMVSRYLDKLSEKRLDDKTIVEFKEISGSTVEIEGRNFTRISIAGECEGDVKNWKTRCQVNVVFLMESFRTRDMIKFEKVDEEGEDVEVDLTLGKSSTAVGNSHCLFILSRLALLCVNLTLLEIILET